MLSLLSEWRTGKADALVETADAWLTADGPCRYSGRTDCGCTYQMTALLLDENHLVIKEFRPECVVLDPDSDDCSWRQVSRGRRCDTRFTFDAAQSHSMGKLT